jgi:LytS/YehU family sensor histidine kinase
MQDLKWNITTIIAFILIALGAFKTWMDANAGKPFDYIGCAFFVLTAISSHFIGSNPNGSKKTDAQVQAQNLPTPPKVQP